jgi:hypothetical protein
LSIADCRLKKWFRNFLYWQSAITNRKSAIPAVLGEAPIAETRRKARRFKIVVLLDLLWFHA